MTETSNRGPVLELEPSRPIEANSPVGDAAPRVGPLRSPGPVRLLPALGAQSVARWTRLSPQPRQETQTPASTSRKFARSFIICVLAPTLIASLYLAFFASDQYVAESRFAVVTSKYEFGEKSDKQKSSPMSGGGSSTGAANQDAYIVSTYIRSRAAVDDISKSINLREVFRRPEADFWRAFPPTPPERIWPTIGARW